METPKQKRRIVGLAGRAGVGKSTAAMMLLNLKDGDGYHVLSFATPLKKMLEAMGVPRECLYGSLYDKNRPLAMLFGKSARQAMITLGTEWGRDMIHPNLWVNLLREEIMRRPYHNIVVDDVRFVSEVNMLREIGALVLGITRPGEEGAPVTHISEGLDFVENRIPTIENRVSLEEFRTALLQLVSAH